MKKLTKKSNFKKENLESYNIYAGCGCECSSYCKKNDGQSSYRNFKSLEGSNSFRE
ncbi:hypothetical protein KQI89_07030 [Clostridium sp. MSJ-4]|uniref:Bacteriocin, CLI_3235 family n=1 Tax=Clostridium simiarum TaxID=2841506 RepID=A0ABS6EZU9_9CLOT|nr:MULTISPECIES: hypothetical protein [Clostridium]MBU5591513.1 hypothetical protein [Clostridium simiarum]